VLTDREHIKHTKIPCIPMICTETISHSGTRNKSMGARRGKGGGGGGRGGGGSWGHRVEKSSILTDKKGLPELTNRIKNASS